MELDTTPASSHTATLFATGPGGNAGQVLEFYNNGGTLQIAYGAGSGLFYNASLSTFYAVIGAQAASGSGGNMYVNGAVTSGTVGTNATNGTTYICNNPSALEYPDLKFIEGAFYNLDPSASATTITTNLRANGGY